MHPLRICPEIVTAPKALNRSLDFGQATGNRLRNYSRFVHVFI
jgi:hypothetical protein